jgi:hypothetical protein
MKKLSLKQCIVFIRLAALALILTIVSLFLFSFSAATRFNDELWRQLGIDKSEGTKSIRESFYYNYLQYYGAKNFKKIAAGNRAAVAKDLLTYTKQYVMGPEFKKAYEKDRLASKPGEPELKPVRTKEQVQKEEIAKTEKMIRDTEESIKKMTPDLQKAMQPVLEQGRKQLKEYQNPNHKMWDIMVQSDVRENEYKKNRYAQELENWNKEYPTDPRVIIKSRLQKFLDLTAGVDYSAELKDRYNKKVFVNPEYERKSSEWKMAFRAGKDVTETARSFVQQWLSELK